MKGIILAGGKATRLYPVTKGVCKQILPVYDKPMIYYPLSVLMLAGITDILIISTPEHTPIFERLLSDGKELGINLFYKIQDEPKGIAEAFIVGEEFIKDDSVCLILGDNIFFGHGLTDLLQECVKTEDSATIFGYYVKDPERYGVVEFDKAHKVVSIEEKPKKPKSNYAVCGVYFYPNDVIKIAKSISPSDRGELEITDVNREYLKRNKLKVQTLGRGYAWLDTGTHDSLLDAASFIRTVEDRQSLKIGCIEEIAYRMGYITDEMLVKLAKSINSTYGEYLLNVLEEGNSAVQF